MKLGLTQIEHDFLTKYLVKPLLLKGAKVWCFGSRARGDHKAFSDIDIMAESNDSLENEISRIKEFFENSNFPYKIDLIEKKNFAKSYLSNFEKEKVQLY